MNIVQLWGFLQKYLLSRKWFWVLLVVLLAAILFGIPTIGAISQVMIGVLIAPFVILVVWLIVLTVHAGNASTYDNGHTTSPTTTTAHDAHGGYTASSSSSGGWGRVFGILVVLAFVLWTGSCVYKRATAPTPATPPAADSSSLPTYRASLVTVIKVGKTPTLYKFSDFPDGCAEMTLVSDASFYPKGDWVTITPPSPAKPWDDAPGIANSQEGISKLWGRYRVCPRTPGNEAWGIEIWQ